MNPKQKLIDILMNRFDARRQGNGVWYTISCPFCGDSPNPHTRHCNIRVSPHDNAMIVHCFQLKCTASGILTRKHLVDMGIYDLDISEFVSKNKSDTEAMIHEEVNKELHLDINTDKNIKVQEYFLRRTNKNLDDNMRNKYRVVEDIKSFIELNKDSISKESIKRLTEYVKEYNYIGFLNPTGTNILLRNIEDNVDKNKRHIKVSFLETSNVARFITHKPYTVEKDNKYEDDNTYICIAEGVFDIINTMEYIMPECSGIWCASPVSGQSGLIRDLTKYYPDKHFVYVADYDVDDRKIKSFIEPIRYRVKDVAVVRNKLSKDVGDMSKPMELYKYNL